MDKLKRYQELKNQLEQYHARPIGDRIKQGSPLEARIKQVFIPTRATAILTRSADYTDSLFESWDKVRQEFTILENELIEAGIIKSEGE